MTLAKLEAPLNHFLKTIFIGLLLCGVGSFEILFFILFTGFIFLFNDFYVVVLSYDPLVHLFMHKHI